MTAGVPSSHYNKTTSERTLQGGGWILIVVGAFLIFFLATEIFTALLFAIPIIIGIVMVSLSGWREKQLKKQRNRDKDVDI
jgi:cobalamin biosynthesis protein CobD/CbiB